MSKIIQGAGGGGKGGGGGHTPYEADNSLFHTAYAKVLDLLSEGEIKGLVTGDLRSVYLDGTPVQNEDGTMNFDNVTWAIRHGTQDQTYIEGFPSVESETGYNFHITQATPFIYTVANPEVDSLRIRLRAPTMSSIQENGDVEGSSVSYAVDVAVGTGPYVETVTGAISGKQRGAFERDIPVPLPAGTSSWRVRVRRTSPDSTSSKEVNDIYAVAVVDIIDSKLTYPNSALFGLQVNAAHFNSVPTRGYYVDGLICRVPTNYDPTTRTYTGIWDGTFKRAWTNNPVWIMYTLAGHPVFGYRGRINYESFDIWSLYEAARYCDDMVPDGKGGMEPRFTLNTYIQTKQQGFELIQNIASVFRAMAYYAEGSIGVSVDRPVDIYKEKPYTNANVRDGQFLRAGSPGSVRYNAAAVGWNNPAMMFKKDIEYVEYANLVAQQGFELATFDRFGCTSQGEANRAGHWAVLTSQMETQTVTFHVSLEGLRHGVGSVIPVLDAEYSGRKQSGRIAAATLTTVTIDRDTQDIAVGDKLICAMGDGYSENRAITAISGRTITVAPAFPSVPLVEAVWGVENDIVPELFRIKRIDEEDGWFKITALEYNPGKFPAIDFGAKIEPRPTIDLTTTQAAPTNLSLTSYWLTTQGIAVSAMTFSWDAAPGAIAYEGAWRRQNGEWIRFGPQGACEVTVENIRAGWYEGYVQAIGPTGARSLPARAQLTQLEGKTQEPPSLAALTATTDRIYAIDIHWEFSADTTEDMQRTEIWYSSVNDLAQASKLVEISYPGNRWTKDDRAGIGYFFWGRLVDKTGNFGPFTPFGPGVFGQTSNNPSDYLEAIAGRVPTLEEFKLLEKGVREMEFDVLGLTSELGNADEALVKLKKGQDVLEVTIGEYAKDTLERLDDLSEELDQRTDDINEELNELGTKNAALEAQLGTLQGTVDDLVNALEYDPGQAYLEGALVNFDGHLYRAKMNVPAGNPPPNDTYWQDLGDYSSLSQVVGDLAARVVDLEVVSVDLLLQVNDLEVKADGIDTRLTQTNTVVAGHTSSITSLSNTTANHTSQINQIVDIQDDLLGVTQTLRQEMDDTTLAINRLDRITAENVMSLVYLQAELGAADGSIKQLFEISKDSVRMFTRLNLEVGDLNSSFTDLVQLTEGVAERVTELEVESDGFNTSITNLQQVTEQLALEVNALKLTTEDMETSITNLSSVVEGVALDQSTLYAGMVRADRRGTGVQELEDALGLNESFSAIRREQMVRVNEMGTQADMLYSMRSEFGEMQAGIDLSMQTVASLEDGISATFGLVLEANDGNQQVITGISAGAAIGADGQRQSNIIFMGDNIYFVSNKNGILHTPFSFDTINDLMFVKGAMIERLSVGSGVFVDWLESDAVGPGGVPVLRLNFRTGEIQLNSPASGGGRMTLTNQLLQVFDSNNTLRVRLGIW